MRWGVWIYPTVKNKSNSASAIGPPRKRSGAFRFGSPSAEHGSGTGPLAAAFAIRPSVAFHTSKLSLIRRSRSQRLTWAPDDKWAEMT